MSHPQGGVSPNAHLLIGEMPAPRQFTARWREGTGLTIAVHAAIVLALLYAGTQVPQILIVAKPILAWHPGFARPAGAGREGSGAAASSSAPRAPFVRTPPRAITASATALDVRVPDVRVPQVATQAMEIVPGAPAGVEVTGGGDAVGTGPGRSVGTGPGSGSGGDGSPGGDVFGVGSGATDPVLIGEVKPSYTVDAMRAKLQGVVGLEAVVLPDGSVDPRRIRITRSLDRVFGLDEQAIRAVTQWRFRPGMLHGKPVPVRVSIELAFTLR